MQTNKFAKQFAATLSGTARTGRVFVYRHAFDYRKTMKLLLTILTLISTILVPFAAGQNSVPPNTDVDPFAIGSGTSFSASGPSRSVPAKPATAADLIIADIEDAMNVIEKSHVGQTDRDQLAKSSIESMLRVLDPHSNYFDQAEYSEFLNDQQSDYSGTGSTISGYVKDGKMGVYIISTFPGSPAFKAGLRFGDRIVAVAGEDVIGGDTLSVRNMVRGRRGTIVGLTIERADTKALETVQLKRERVPQPTIAAFYLLENGVGYVELSGGFGYATADELDRAIADLKRQGMKSLVLDLRGNTGGLLDQAVKVAEKFLPAGSLIVSQRGRRSNNNRVWHSANRNHETMPLTVLVDRSTASASEIVAGAIQDNDRGLIVGERTYGKGLVQNVLDLPFGSGLTLTTARYFTPSGRSIQREYAGGGNYEYFNHLRPGSKNSKPETAARTTTHRPVYGGDGIEPDESLRHTELNDPQAALLDPIFFFAREYVNGRLQDGSKNVREEIRQKIIFGDSPLSEEIFTAFCAFVEKEKSWDLRHSDLTNETQFIKTRLRYDLAMAVFGISAANRVKTEDDPHVARAIAALPDSAKLAESASKLLAQKRK